MLKIRDVETVPSNEGWSYFVEATGTTISTKNYSILYSRITQHCQSNNVPVPSWQDVIDQMCQRLFIPCYEGLTPLVNKWSLNLPRPRTTSSCCREVNIAPIPKESV